MRKENYVLFVCMMLHMGGFGVLGIEKHPNIFKVTVFFMLMMLGMLTMMFNKNYWCNFVATIVFAGGSFFLFREFVGKPKDWSFYETGMNFLILSNCFLISFFMEKLKTHSHA